MLLKIISKLLKLLKKYQFEKFDLNKKYFIYLEEYF